MEGEKMFINFTMHALARIRQRGKKHGRRKKWCCDTAPIGGTAHESCLKKTPYEKLNAANNGSSVFPARGQKLIRGR